MNWFWDGFYTVIPAQAGIQSPYRHSRPCYRHSRVSGNPEMPWPYVASPSDSNPLDSRLRGNDAP